MLFYVISGNLRLGEYTKMTTKRKKMSKEELAKLKKKLSVSFLCMFFIFTVKEIADIKIVYSASCTASNCRIHALVTCM